MSIRSRRTTSLRVLFLGGGLRKRNGQSPVGSGWSLVIGHRFSGPGGLLGLGGRPFDTLGVLMPGRGRGDVVDSLEGRVRLCVDVLYF